MRTKSGRDNNEKGLWDSILGPFWLSKRIISHIVNWGSPSEYFRETDKVSFNLVALLRMLKKCESRCNVHNHNSNCFVAKCHWVCYWTNHKFIMLSYNVFNKCIFWCHIGTLCKSCHHKIVEDIQRYPKLYMSIGGLV